MTEPPSNASAWWETLTFTHGPETEWFVRSVFADACRGGKTIYWRCMPARGSVDEVDQRLAASGFRLVLEHRDQPHTRGEKDELHRVYVLTDGNGVAVVTREGATAIRLSIASFDAALADRLANPPPFATPSRKIPPRARHGRRPQRSRA